MFVWLLLGRDLDVSGTTMIRFTSFFEIHPAIAWAAAWYIGTISILATGGSNGWQEGGAILGVAGAFFAWILGALSSVAAMRRRTPWATRLALRAVFSGWIVAFGVGIGSAIMLGVFFESRPTVPSFVGFIIGAAVAGAIAGLSTAAFIRMVPRSLGPLVGGGILVASWMVAWGMALFIALVAGSILGQSFKMALEQQLGWHIALSTGWGVAGAIAGALAGIAQNATLDIVYGEPQRS